MRIHKRGKWLYLSHQQEGVRVRISTNLVANAENKLYLNWHWREFIKDKRQALENYRAWQDLAFDKTQKALEISQRNLVLKQELKALKQEQNKPLNKAYLKLQKSGETRFFVASVFEAQALEKQGLKKNSLKSFNSSKRAILSFLESRGIYDIRDISRGICAEWTMHLKESGLLFSSIKTRTRALNSLLNFAVQNDLIAKNPFVFVKLSEVKKSEPIMPFNLDEIQALIKSASGELKSYLIVAFFTGARTGELFGLKWDDVDFEKDEIHIKRSGKDENSTKTKGSRSIDMLEIVKSELISMHQKRTSEFVFNASWKSISEDFKALQAALKLKERRLYDTRHSFASVMLEKGEEAAWIGLKMLGHSSLTTTFKVYARFLPNKTKKRASFTDELDLGVAEKSLFDEVTAG